MSKHKVRNKRIPKDEVQQHARQLYGLSGNKLTEVPNDMCKRMLFWHLRDKMDFPAAAIRINGDNVFIDAKQWIEIQERKQLASSSWITADMHQCDCCGDFAPDVRDRVDADDTCSGCGWMSYLCTRCVIPFSGKAIPSSIWEQPYGDQHYKCVICLHSNIADLNGLPHRYVKQWQEDQQNLTERQRLWCAHVHTLYDAYEEWEDNEKTW